MSKVLILSNMYPSNKFPTYGIFVKNQLEWIREYLGSEDIIIDKIVIDNPNKGVKKYLLWSLDIIKYIIKNKNIKLMHVHYIFPTGLPAYLLYKALNIPYIVTVHGGDYYSMAKRNIVTSYFTKLILMNAKHIIVVGKDLKLSIKKDLNPSVPISILNMGVNTKVFFPIEQISLKNNEKRILFVGNYLETKGLMDLVDSLVILK